MEAHRILKASPLPPRATEPGAAQVAPTVAATALSGIAAGLSSGMALAPLLGSVAAAASRAFAADRCLIYLREVGGRDFVGTVAHEEHGVRPGLEWIARARISASTSGIEQALNDSDIALVELPWSGPRRTHAGIAPCASLVVAIPAADDAVGVMVLERTRSWVLGDEDEAWLRAFASVAGAAVTTARCTETADRQRHVLAARVRDERQIAEGFERLLQAALDDRELAELLSILASVLGLPCALLSTAPPAVIACDAGGRSTRAPRVCDEDVSVRGSLAAELADLEQGRSRVVGPYPEHDVGQRQLVTKLPALPAVQVLIVSESGRELARADLRVAQDAAALLALRMRQSRQTRDAQAAERASIVRDAVSGGDGTRALRMRAAAAGVDLERPSVVCLVACGDGSDGGAEVDDRVGMSVRGLVDQLGLERLALASGTRHGMTIIAPLDPGVSRRVAIAAVRSDLERLLEAWPAGLEPPVVTVSSACLAAGELERALCECLEVRRSAARLGRRASAGSVLCADDLGVAKLLVGQLSGAAATRFAADLFGTMDDEQERDSTVATLDAFFAENQLVRATAQRLGVHENTVRYRLRKFAVAAGLDVLSSGEDQLTARLALTVLKLGSSVTIEKEHS